MLRTTINGKVMDYMESLFGIIYLYFVLKNLLWFIKPLQDREEYALLWAWFEDKAEWYEEKFQWVVDKMSPWRRKKVVEKEEESSPSRGRKSWGRAVMKVSTVSKVTGEKGKRKTATFSPDLVDKNS